MRKFWEGFEKRALYPQTLGRAAEKAKSLTGAALDKMPMAAGVNKANLVGEATKRARQAAKFEGAYERKLNMHQTNKELERMF